MRYWWVSYIEKKFSRYLLKFWFHVGLFLNWDLGSGLRNQCHFQFGVEFLINFFRHLSSWTMVSPNLSSTTATFSPYINFPQCNSLVVLIYSWMYFNVSSESFLLILCLWGTEGVLTLFFGEWKRCQLSSNFKALIIIICGKMDPEAAEARKLFHSRIFRRLGTQKWHGSNKIGGQLSNFSSDKTKHVVSLARALLNCLRFFYGF